MNILDFILGNIPIIWSKYVLLNFINFKVMFYLQAGQSGGMVNLVFFASIFLIMYFFFLRPQVKRQKAQEKFATDLSKGSEVVTSSGIIGKINKIEDDVIHLQIDQKTFIRVIRGAISKEMTENLVKKKIGNSN